ncbi:NlpC/P60 family protein [Gordonia sp. HNM0687]|uniref:NlpC/P60 family protein n=1 Tax=Gordonia mangrovi TaxID=2665643 RepID=A0A6L7GUZ5_9ACTN|nr:NlpC/P60 family protein [Gordonia mangrovi]MXP23287.1 NlpC/P60 family protein [Gordonia mangrovi]UVF76795.1 C40 family peptidase [Gordonia mangrovi]
MQNIRCRLVGVLCALGLATGVGVGTAAEVAADTGSSGSSGSVEIYLPIPTPAGMQALTAAMTQLGRPYEWGGTGPWSWDCSGLMQWAFSTAGIRLPRTSQEQARVGHSIPLSALAPGDLIVFYRDASHIGIYAGFGQVFNAYGPNGAPIGFTPLNHWSHIKTIRRLG